jgi:hypothetical protein
LPIFDPLNVTTLYQTPYSPDFTPPEYCLFLKLNMKFADVVEIPEAVINEFKKVQKEKFSAALQKLYNRAKAFKYTNGDYFE